MTAPMPRPVAVAFEADAQPQSSEPVTAGGPYDAASCTGAPPATATKGVSVIMLFAPIGPTLFALYVMKIAPVLAGSSCTFVTYLLLGSGAVLNAVVVA